MTSDLLTFASRVRFQFNSPLLTYTFRIPANPYCLENDLHKFFILDNPVHRDMLGEIITLNNDFIHHDDIDSLFGPGQPHFLNFIVCFDLGSGALYLQRLRYD